LLLDPQPRHAQPEATETQIGLVSKDTSPLIFSARIAPPRSPASY